MTTQEIIYTVTNVYLSIIVAKDKLELLERQRKLSDKQVAMVKKQIGYGLATQQDVDNAEQVAEQNEVAYEAAAGLAVQSFIKLGLMLGIDDPHSFTIQTDFPPMPPLPTFESMVNLLQDHQPLVLQQQALLGAAKAQARAGPKPHLADV